MLKSCFSFNPQGCKHNPRYYLLICSLALYTAGSEKLSDILIKIIANHCRCFCMVEKRSELLLARSRPSPGWSHTQAAVEKYLFQKLHLKEFLKCSISRFADIGCFTPNASLQLLVSERGADPKLYWQRSIFSALLVTCNKDSSCLLCFEVWQWQTVTIQSISKGVINT